MTNLYALLIGIDDYDEREVNGISYPKLGGAVRDVNQVHAFLRDTLQVPADQILKLTAPRAGAGVPEGALPTYANLVAAFQGLTAMAQQPGDQAYIHYSGHGGRAATAFPQLKGEHAFDEAIVPVDIGDPAAQYLRDVEIHYLIKQLVEKGLEVTLVFDSCHSGGATRGSGQAVPRGIGESDRSVRPHTSAVAEVAALATRWQAETAVARSVKPAGGWLMESNAYTLLAACRASESAYEYPFTGGERSGALTHFLLETLRQPGPDLSYRTVMDRIVGQVHGLFAQQTPMLQGDGNRRFLGTDQITAVHAVRVLEVTVDGMVRLQAGEVHGIAPGAKFNLFPFNADPTDSESAVAMVEIKRVDSAECTGTLLDGADPAAVAAGDLAVLIGAANVKLQRTVRIDVADEARHSALAAAITRHGKGFVVAAQPDEPPIFQVLVSADGQRYEICDPAGRPLPHVPAAALGDADALHKTVERLVHLAKFYNARDLSAPGAEAAAKLTVALVDPPPAIDGQIIYRPGDTITVRVTNNQLPGAMNDATRILNVTALDLASDWSITQVHPTDGDYESLDPGLSTDIELGAYLPDGIDATVDIIKVFATRATTDFRWLQLPALDEAVEHLISTKRAAGDPLALLHEQLVDDKVIATRSVVRIENKPKRTWTVAAVELHVVRAQDDQPV